MTRDDFVKFSRLLYGAGWPDCVAQKVGMNRRDLVKEINGTESVPPHLRDLIVELTEAKIQELKSELDAIKLEQGEEESSTGKPAEVMLRDKEVA